MSVMKPILNGWLKLTEKPHMARANGPGKLRRSFETKARFYFRGPHGSVYKKDRIGAVPVLHVHARSVDPQAGPLMFYIHGGGYIFGSPRTHKAMLAQLSQRTGLPACLPDYRKAPEHPFPAAVEDVVACYRALADHPGGVIIGGDSAGGGLALALNLEIQRLGLPQPHGIFLLSPLTDLSFTTPSVAANEHAEVVLPVSSTASMVKMYMGDQNIAQPTASPLWGDFTGSAPIWLCVGDTEILLDNSVQMAERLQAQGVETTLIVEQNLPHVWPLFHNLLPEARATLDQLASWIMSLPPRSADS